MIVYLKNNGLWIKYKNNLIEITNEAEKYLFGTCIDCSEAILGDFFQVLNKNKHLYEMFAMPKSISIRQKQVGKFVDFYKDKSGEEIKKSMLKQRNKLMQLEMEIIKDDNNNNKGMDFVGVGVEDKEKYSMSLSNIENLYFLPLIIKFYHEEDGTNNLTEIYNKIKNGFDLVSYNASLEKPMSDIDNNLLLNVISNKTSLANNLTKKARRKVEDNLIRKKAHTEIFSNDIFLVKEIFYNVLFNTNVMNEEILKIRYFENEVKDIRVDSLNLQDKGELMFQSFLNDNNKNLLFVSEYLRED